MSYNSGAELWADPESADSTTAATASPRGFLKDVVGRIGKKIFGKAVRRRTDDDLETAILRLAETSPHLLLDIGVDPATGEVMPQIELPRPIVTFPRMRSSPDGQAHGSTRVTRNTLATRPMGSNGPGVAT